MKEARRGAECEERLTRWILGTQTTLETGDALPPFSTAVAAIPKRTNQALKSNYLYTGTIEQEVAARSAVETRQNNGNSGAPGSWRNILGVRRSTMGTCSVPLGRASSSPLHAGPCGTPRE